MKSLATLARHLLTALAGLAAYIATYDPAAVTAPGVPVDPISGLAVFAAIALTRWALAVLISLFAWIAKNPKGGDADGLWLIAGLAAVGIFGSLPSCSPSTLEAFRAFPVRIGIQSENAAASYSSADGLDVRAVIVPTK